MSLNITEQQYRTALQNVQSRHIWLELLNYQYQTVEELSGICIGGSISIDANSDIRRTGSIQLAINNSTFEVESGGKIWLDKYIRVWVGTDSLSTRENERVNCGMYLIDAPSYNYDPSTNTLTLTLLDLMAKLTGARNGYAEKTPIILKAGENIRQAIIETLKLGGFTKYIVEEAPSPGIIPNDLEFGQGCTYYEVLAGLRDIYPNYEIFFDTNGVFYYKMIPTGENEPILVKDSIWQSIVLSEDINTDFQSIKNSIEVFGRTHEPQTLVTNENVKITDNNITITASSVEKYVDDIIYGFEIKDPKELINFNIKINSLANLPVLNDDDTKATIRAETGNTIFCVQYVTKYSLKIDGKEVINASGLTQFLNAVNKKYNKKYTATSEITEGGVEKKESYWRWLGHLQAHGLAEDTNQNSPFNINSTVGKIYLPLLDGNYSNCITDDLAQQRAEHELYLHTNMKNSVSISCVPVYWLDVNILVEYTLFRNNKKGLYLIKSLEFGLAPSDNMTVNMITFYPDNI